MTHDHRKHRIDPQYAIDPAQIGEPAALPYEAYPSTPGPAVDRQPESRAPVQGPAAAGGATPRYGQLSYTSFDTSDRPGGGWQVKDTRGGLDERETELLRDQVSTQFDAGIDLPQFPTPEQVAGLPRRMVHAPLGPDASAIWHTAPAGTDASGRPGNVFAQMVLDRNRRLVEGPRPIELWRSPDWRTPFGPDAVREAVLGADLPQPGEAVTPATVVDFVLDPQAFRLPVLSVLLDACRAAMGGGPPVALLCETIEHGALWIGAVSLLMSPEQSRQFFFSTLERATGLPAVFARGVQLACVPSTDIEAAGRETQHVLIAETEIPQLGDAGGAPHGTARGDRVEVSPWSAMAQVVLANGGGLREVSAEASRIAALVQGDQPASGVEDPLWATALAVVRLGPAYREARDEAAALLAGGAPPALAGHAELLGLTERTVLDHVPATTAGAWTAAASGAGSTLVSAVLARTYLERAVADLDWLTQEGGIPVPTREVWGTTDLTRARAGAATMAGDLADMAAADPETVGLAALRLSGLAAAAGLDDRRDDGTVPADQGALTRALTDVLRNTVLPILLGPGGPGFVRRVGPLAAPTVDQLRSLVSQSEQFAARPVGRRLERGVLEWLFPTGCGAELPASTRLTPADRLRGEVAVHLADQVPRMRPLATWVTLAEGADPSTVNSWFTTAWPIEALVPLLDTFGDRLPPELWLGTVKAAPDSPALTTFCRRLVGSTWNPSPYAGQAVVAVAELRLLDQQWWRREHPEITKAVLGGSAAQTAPAIPFAPRAERDIQLAMIMAVLDPQVLDRDEQHLDELAPLIEGRRIALPEDVWDAIASYASRVPTTDLVAGLASTVPDLDVRSTPEQARWTWLGAITRDGVGLVRSLVRHRLTGQDAPNAAALVDQLKELPTRQPVGDHRARERQWGAWVKELLPVKERGLGRLFGGAG